MTHTDCSELYAHTNNTLSSLKGTIKQAQVLFEHLFLKIVSEI